jgi:hypothetical protein
MHIPNCSNVTVVDTSRTALMKRSCAHPELQYNNVRVHIQNYSTIKFLCQKQQAQVKVQK